MDGAGDALRGRPDEPPVQVAPLVAPFVAPVEVVLGVGGGIAAYKACELLRLFTESGHRVRVVPTAAALHFVGAVTWAALSGQPVATDVWTDAHDVPHVRLGQHADLVVVAPATADLLARAAHGLADDLLTNILLTARCPVIYALAMHTEMWEHPATVANVALLRARGAVVLDPDVGRLTGADTGRGRLPEPAEIFAVARAALAGRGPAGQAGHRAAARADLAGRHVVVTAGGTREPIDPVRFIGNRSSGKQGYAFARTALARGARVTLISANVALPDPAGTRIVRVGSAEELRAATLAVFDEADAVIMAAAPADFRPERVETQKIKKDRGVPTITLTANPDIAAELGARKRPDQVLVVFAAETTTAEDAVANARDKMRRKRADLVVLNEVGVDKTFGADRNAAVVLGSDGYRTDIGERSKEDLADVVWSLVAARLSDGTPGRSGSGDVAGAGEVAGAADVTGAPQEPRRP